MVGKVKDSELNNETILFREQQLKIYRHTPIGRLYTGEQKYMGFMICWRQYLIQNRTKIRLQCNIYIEIYLHEYSHKPIYGTVFMCLRGDCHIPIMLILGTFFSETNKHRTVKLYIATFPLSMHKLRFFCKHW